MNRKAVSVAILTLLLASILSMALDIAPTAGTLGWEVYYSADELPDESEPPWELTEDFVDDTGVAMIVDGTLRLDTTSENGTWTYRRDWDADNSVGVIVEARLRVEMHADMHNSELELNIADGVYAAMVEFFEDRVYLFNVGEYLMNTTDDYHVYRLIAKEDDIFLYVDDSLRLDGTDKFTYKVTENRILFGDGATPAEVLGAISYWDYVAYTTTPPVSTAVYFNLNPNPASVGDTLTLKGILVDKSSEPLSGETIRLYARPLLGSWRYVTSLTTNSYGIFTWQAKIPEVPLGAYILAAYYSGSERYESCYNFAVLIIQ